MISELEFFKYLEGEVNIKLTKEQREAVITCGCPVALISTAGSGKTSVVTTKIAYLILVMGLLPSRILVTSFSNQSAADMEERFINRFGRKIKDKVPFSTIHSFAFSVFRDYAAGLNMQYSIIESPESPVSKNQLLSNLYKKHTKESVTEDKLKELSGFVSYIKNLMVLYNDLDKYADQFPVPCFKEIYKDYEETKRDYIEEGKGKVRLLDFDDMLSMCHHALKKNPKMLEKYRTKYDYYIVDEAQDTSLVQNAIIRLISYPKHSLCMVGDPRQSIYSWRGAVVEELVNFKDRYPGARVLYMDRNFRSTKAIVSASAEFIKIQDDKLNNNIYTENEQGAPIDFVAAEDELKQMDYIVNLIKDRKDFSEVAVLYRNNISAIPLVEKLSREGIPYFIKDEVSSFFNHWVTNDITKFFQFSQKQWNVELFSDIYYKIKSYVSKKDVETLYFDLSTFDKAGKSVFERLSENPTYEKQKSKLLDFESNFKILATTQPKRAIAFIESELNYKEYLKEYAKKFNYNLDGIDNILSTLKVICSELEDIGQFKAKMDLLQSQMIHSKKNKGTNAVTLSTSHSSKGLEWDEVFFIDTHNIPSTDSIKKLNEGDKASYNEETRVFFVSITRARKFLHVMYCQRKNGQRIESSVFYKKLLKIVTPVTQRPVASREKTSTTIFPPLEKGFTVAHKKWGVGEIMNVDGDIITVAFIDGSVRRLSIAVCSQTGILKLVS
jgi:DNA helicase-2/ATP-dependent DNA helicase PcrA